MDFFDPSGALYVFLFHRGGKLLFHKLTRVRDLGAPVLTGLIPHFDHVRSAVALAFELTETRGKIHAPAAEGDTLELAGEILRHGERILEMDADHAIPSE